MTAHKDLYRIVAHAVYGEPNNLSRATEAVDAILAAGWRPPVRRITSAAEIADLGDRSVLLRDNENTYAWIVATSNGQPMLRDLGHLNYGLWPSAIVLDLYGPLLLIDEPRQR